jgi:hypothetical protein
MNRKHRPLAAKEWSYPINEVEQSGKINHFGRDFAAAKMCSTCLNRIP